MIDALMPGSEAPAVGSSVCCARCRRFYDVVNDDGTGLVLMPSVGLADWADTEASWCPACVTSSERALGATFTRTRECCHGTPASCAVCDLPTCMGCRRRRSTRSMERKTGVVACVGCDELGLFAMGRPAVFIVIEDDYESSRTVSVWSTRSAAQAEIERLNAADRHADYHIEGEVLRLPEDVQR